MNSTKNETLALQEIKDGYYLCQDSADIKDWLKNYSQHFKKINSIINNDIYACPMIVNEKGRFDAYFIFREVVNNKVRYMLFYIPAFISKKFNLLALHIRYKGLNIEQFYKSLFKQLNKLSSAVNHPCPIYGCCENDFMGFFYLPETFLCEN